MKGEEILLEEVKKACLSTWTNNIGWAGKFSGGMSKSVEPGRVLWENGI